MAFKFTRTLGYALVHTAILLRTEVVTRFQRAGKSAGHSAAGSGDDVIEGRRVRLGNLPGRFPIVLGDGAVDTEPDRLILGRQPGQAVGPFETFDPYPGHVYGLFFTHFKDPFALCNASGRPLTEVRGKGAAAVLFATSLPQFPRRARNLTCPGSPSSDPGHPVFLS